MSQKLTEIPITFVDRETKKEIGTFFLTDHQAKMAAIIGSFFESGGPIPFANDKDKP